MVLGSRLSVLERAYEPDEAERQAAGVDQQPRPGAAEQRQQLIRRHRVAFGYPDSLRAGHQARGLRRADSPAALTPARRVAAGRPAAAARPGGSRAAVPRYTLAPSAPASAARSRSRAAWSPGCGPSRLRLPQPMAR